MMEKKLPQREKFDGLADDYDRYRPRYPQELFATMVSPLIGKTGLSIVDVGAGTGIALERMVSMLGTTHQYHAIDISSDMIRQGQKKFPDVCWHQGQAETVLAGLSGVDLVVAAQSFQWMDRPQLLSVVSRQLRPGGVMGVIQNNRNFEASDFLSDYESLLESMNSGYSRYYRQFDYLQEMTTGLEASAGDVVLHTHDWSMRIPADAFVGMSRSSTQAQRAMTAYGEQFFNQLAALIQQYEEDGILEILYRSELYMYTNR